jgi:hypothetical protein
MIGAEVLMPTRLPVLVLLIACCAASSSEALILLSNRLPNPHFDTDIDGWTGDPEASWAGGFDVDNDPSSGSLRIQVPGEAGAVREARACVPIAGGEFHVFGSRYFIPPGQVPSGEARVIVQWYDEPGCVGFMQTDGVGYDQDHGVIGAWTNLVDNATPPVNADSASLALSGWKLVGQENQPDFVIYFDAASLLPEPGGALGATAAIAALALRRAIDRRRPAQ